MRRFDYCFANLLCKYLTDMVKYISPSENIPLEAEKRQKITYNAQREGYCDGFFISSSALGIKCHSSYPSLLTYPIPLFSREV